MSAATSQPTDRHHPDPGDAPASGPGIALLGPYASRNLGDTATQLAAIAELRRLRPDCRLFGISPEPDDTLRSLGLSAFPLDGGSAAAGLHGALASPATGRIARLRRMLRFVRSLDLLIISGGGQLDDFWGGPWGHPWALLKWGALARHCGVPVAYLGVGIDRLDAWLSRRFALAALRAARYRAFRDQRALAALRQIGLDAPAAVCPDLAFGLVGAFPSPPHPAERFVVINPLSQLTWTRSSDPRHDAYVDRLASVAAAIAGRGWAIRIACSQPAMDMADAHRIAAALAARHVESTVCRIGDVRSYINQVAGADLVIGARLHGVILALVAGAPVVALSPLPKVERLMQDIGFGDLCLPLQSFTAEQLQAHADRVLGDADAARAKVRLTAASLRSRLDAVWRDVLALIATSTAERGLRRTRFGAT